ncbi:histone-like nucleoid-structuring protein Lsr2 [Streptomyces roseolus]|uniref:Lsr2 family DNA-binding protein n=1 Tax=Streptomyces roseolus TaxID=67358 RepID=UPI003654FBC0
MTSLAALTRLVPPPASPLATDWNAVETLLQVPLPTDYKQLVDAYGPGSFCDFLHLSTPHRNREAVDLTGPMPARLRGQLLKDRDTGTYPMPHRPEDLFAVGVTDNGNHLFWITTPRAEPDAWPLTVNEAEGRTWYTHDGNLTSFLLALLSGHEHPPVFPRDLLSRSAFFTPESTADTDSRPTPHPSGSITSTAAIREWARAQGYDVPDRGRIPASLIQAWEQSH